MGISPRVWYDDQQLGTIRDPVEWILFAYCYDDAYQIFPLKVKLLKKVISIHCKNLTF